MQRSELNVAAIDGWLTKNRVPRPVFLFFVAVLVLASITKLVGSGGSKPERIATAVSEGLMSIFHDDESLKNLVLIFTKNGKNDQGTAEIRDFGAGLGRLFMGGGVVRAGGSLYFTDYQQSGITLNGGPLDVEVSNADEDAARYRIQGSVTVSGIDRPVAIQIEFIRPKDTYDVNQLKGKIKINETITDL